MKERILRLCKRLDKFTFEDISAIAEDVDELVLKPLLLTLVNEKRLILKKGIYFYNKPAKNKQISTFKYFSKQTIELIIRCFCIELSAEKTALIADVSEDTVFKLYNYFREQIFLRQKEVLIGYYNENPKKARTRRFFKTKNIYLYIYNNQVFISDATFTLSDERNFTESETKEFKKICCYLSRIECHNKNEINLHYRIAEALWRRNKKFEELFNDLKLNLLNIS